MATIAADTFTRANNGSVLGTADTGQSWTATDGTWGISSNQAYNPSAGSGFSAATVNAGVADGIVSVVIATYGGDDGLTLRQQDASNYLLVDFASGLVAIYEYVASNAALLAFDTAAFSSGDAIAVVLSGTAIDVRKNGISVLSITTTRFQTATKHGLWSYTPTSAGATRFDTFSITDGSSALHGLGALGVGALVVCGPALWRQRRMDAMRDGR